MNGAIEKMLKKHGFTYTHVHDYDLNQIAGNVQVRSESNVAPASSVQRFRRMMDADVQFPAVIVSRNNILVDGNTRVAAQKKRKTAYVEAFVLDLDYSADPATTDERKVTKQVQLFATEANNTNGVNMSTADAIKKANEMILTGATEKAITRVTALSRAQVGGLKSCIKATEKMTALGLTVPGEARCRALGTEDLLNLSSEVYRGVVDLANDADLDPEEIKALRKRLKDADGDVAKRALLASERTSFVTRVQMVAANGRYRPSESAKLRRALGLVLSGQDPMLFVEQDPSSTVVHTKVLSESIAVLQSVLSAQELL